MTTADAQPPVSTVEIPDAKEILSTLRKEHPRLLASEKDFEELKKRVESDPRLKQWREKLSEGAEKLLSEPPSKYEIPDGKRLLQVSRRVTDRVYRLALAYRLSGEKKFAERAWKELEAAAQFKDWNPKHFLDTAEMTHAFGIGYDWLYEVWTDEQRAKLREAIIEKGLKPALEVYHAPKGKRWWADARHNWNQVCNGGNIIGALAIADDAPDIAGEVLEFALKSLPKAMKEFAPDGACEEGPGYWNYAVVFNVHLLAALESALGRDFGFSKMEGFDVTGLFPIYMTGPLGKTFNFADGSDGTIRAPQMFWLARKFNQPIYAWYQSRVASGTHFDILWHNTLGDNFTPTEVPLDKHFRRADIVSFRSSWTDEKALFVGFKGGDNKANHSHLDLGTFVLDADGARWALDMGVDDYNLPGYFDKDNFRWVYHRMRAEAHNTLVINPGADPDQLPTAVAAVTRFVSKPNHAFAITDLTAAYAKHAQKVARGIALLDRKQVLVQDEVASEKPAEIWWFMHTQAEIKISDDGGTAILSQGDAKLQARILSPADGKFEVMDAKPLPTSPQPDGVKKNEGIRKLAVNLKGVKDVRLAVLLTPLREKTPEPPKEIAPLEKW